MALAVKDAVDFVGMPEARINLAHGVTVLARAPKGNASYVAFGRAQEEVRETGALPVPLNLRNAVTSLMKNEGYGKGYAYAHDDPKGAATQQHLPDGVKRRSFFPTVGSVDKA